MKSVFTRRRIIFMILLLVVLGGCSLLLRDYLRSAHEREMQESLAALATQEEAESQTEPATQPEDTEVPEETPYVSPIDFDALRAENPDTVGWIRIPDTRIDYPIVQSEDNSKYLDHGFDGKKNVYGTIYLDSDSTSDFSGWNNPLYGHHMKDGSMFKGVVKFKDPEYFKAHQFFEIYTPERTIHLKAVACYYTDSDGIVRKTKFNSQESFDAWVEERLAPCSFAERPEVSVGSMFVLVTCSYEFKDARTLLYAVEVDENGTVIPSNKTETLDDQISQLLQPKS